MASSSLLRPTISQTSYICARCAFRASKISPRTSKRWIGIKYLTKVAEAEIQWQEKASRIRQGQEKSMLTILEERGLIQNITGSREQLDKNMTNSRLGAYVGVDPTASSLHIGHMIPFMSLFWMYLHGFHAVSLLGGATSKIGDPTGRLKTREGVTSSTNTANMFALHYQIKKLWGNVETVGQKYGYEWEWSWHRELVNNNHWWNKATLLEILQTLGHGMRLGPMLARDTVKTKLTQGDGMSFAEFSYPIMQAWDWWHMYHKKGISLQIGGSDQFGNITAGATAVSYMSKSHPDPAVRRDIELMTEPVGFTVPLLTTSSGAKFGKSEGNAVWLDQAQTSIFDLYGFFMRVPDADVGKYLKMLTFMPIDQIDALVLEHQEAPEQRKAQHKLAREFVELVHGAHEAKQVELQHRLLFKGTTLTPEEQALLSSEPDSDSKAGIITLNNKPEVNIKLPRSLIATKTLPKILFAAKLADSSSAAQRALSAGGIYISGHPDGKKLPMQDGMVSWTKCHPWGIGETLQYIIHDDLLMFRKGKHNIRIVQIVSDEEYEASGETYQGQFAPDSDRLSKPDPESDLASRIKVAEEERRAKEQRFTIGLQGKQAARERHDDPLSGPRVGSGSRSILSKRDD